MGLNNYCTKVRNERKPIFQSKHSTNAAHGQEGVIWIGITGTDMAVIRRHLISELRVSSIGKSRSLP